MRRPLVSVVMNCYNGARYVREALDSVYAQSYPHWEIVFWDNASTDATADIVAGYDRRVRYFRSEGTRPLGEARNRAVAQAKGEFIAFLDSDDRWHRDKLERQLGLFADERVGIVYCDVTSFNEKGERRKVSTRKRLPKGDCFEDLLVEYGIYMSSLVFRTAALRRDGLPFNEAFEVVEEADLVLRMALRWRVDFVPETLAEWRVHGTSGLWSKYELMALESEEMLRGLKEAVPGLEQRYRRAFGKKRAWVSRTRAIAQWRQGEGKNARHTIRCASPKTSDLWVLWVLTFFPARVVLPWVYRMRAAVVYPVERPSGD